MDHYVTVRDLAREINMDRSHFRRYILKRGVTPVLIRDRTARMQLVLALNEEQVHEVKEFLRLDGYTGEPVPWHGDGGRNKRS